MTALTSERSLGRDDVKLRAALVIYKERVKQIDQNEYDLPVIDQKIHIVWCEYTIHTPNQAPQDIRKIRISDPQQPKKIKDLHIFDFASNRSDVRKADNTMLNALREKIDNALWEVGLPNHEGIYPTTRSCTPNDVTESKRSIFCNASVQTEPTTSTSLVPPLIAASRPFEAPKSKIQRICLEIQKMFRNIYQIYKND